MFRNILASFLLVVGTVVSLSASGAGTPAVALNHRLTALIPEGKVAFLNAIPDHLIHVDGDLAEWGNLADHSTCIDQTLDRNLGPSTPGLNDAAVFKIAHDSEALYVAVRVSDASVETNKEAIYNGDSVELFLDVRDPQPAAGPALGDAAYSNGVYQLQFSPPTRDGAPFHWQPAGSGPRKLGPIEAASQLLPDGYTLEVRIPISSLSLASADRFKQPVGFDLAINDVDPAPGGFTPRTSYSFGRSSDHWQNASVFGLADSMGRGLTTPPILRTIPTRYMDDAGGRMILGGLITTSAIGAKPTEIEVALFRTDEHGKIVGVPLPPATRTETIRHPDLGMNVLRKVISFNQMKTGRYLIKTRFSGSAKVEQSSFEALSWRRSPSAAQVNAARHTHDYADATLGMLGVRLPNGWRITPAGIPIRLGGDMPLKMLFSPDRRHLFVETAGFNRHGVDVIDTSTLKVTQGVDLGHAWAGFASSPDGKTMYVSGGNIYSGERAKTPSVFQNAVIPLSWDGRTLTARPGISLPAQPLQNCYIAGLAAGKDGTLFVINIEDNRIYRLAGTPLTVQAATRTGYRPYSAVLLPDGKILAVSNWGDASISMLDAGTLQEVGSVPVGIHPGEMAAAADGRLYVANAGSNSVSVIRDGGVTETIRTTLTPDAPVGSTPDALALSPNGKTLYVANAGNNDVAVVDVSQPGESRVLGFIPTGWYPTALAAAPDGRTLYVGTAKGLIFTGSAPDKYIGQILTGHVCAIPVPTPAVLARYTRQVYANAPKANNLAEAPADAKKAFSKIKHVVYVIRENRTYDQVFGDLPVGNGEPSLTLFGRDVTPNAHALATRTVVLDNLYCSGEVSEDGHEWCNAAYATDFTEKAWPLSYSSRGEPEGDERLTKSPGGYLWDNCERHGVTYRSYGEYANFTVSKDSPPIYHGEAALKGHSSAAWSLIPWTDGRDTERASIFIRELHTAEKTGQWPQYMVMSLPEDHTHGGAAGTYTPIACVASNDQALGRIVEAVSHSRFWSSTAIFVIEDDAQSGPDHVDAHRTVGLVISPYVRRHVVDSTFYTTASFVHTMEMILGLPPMSQFDASATPLYNAFTSQPDMQALNTVSTRVNLLAKNGANTPAALLSAKLDFSAPDRAEPTAFNHLLWAMLKPGVAMPAPVRCAWGPAYLSIDN